MGGVKMHQRLPANLSQTSDKGCRAQWSRCAGIKSNNPELPAAATRTAAELSDDWLMRGERCSGV